MKFLSTTGLAAVLIVATAYGQTAKPSPYQGVSHPPSDDAIVTNDLDGTTSQSSGVASISPPTPHMETMPTSRHADEDSPNTPGLVNRTTSSEFDPDGSIVTSVPSGPNQLPEGTILKVTLNQRLSTATTLPGAEFSARVVEAVTKNGKVVIPVGSIVSGRVTSVSAGRRIRGGASIRLRPDEVDLPDGTRYFLHAEVYDLSARQNVKTDSEGNVLSVDHGKRTAAEAGLLGGGVAAAGFLIAGGPAALIGGAAAAGYVGAHWLLENHEAVLPKDSEVVFGLTQPMSLVSFHE